MCFFSFCFYIFIKSWKTSQLMWENFVFLVIFDTCDVVYNWFISLLPPIVLVYLVTTIYTEYRFLYGFFTWKLRNKISSTLRLKGILAINLNFIIPISLQPERVNPWYFILVWNIREIRQLGPNIYRNI